MKLIKAFRPQRCRVCNIRIEVGTVCGRIDVNHHYCVRCIEGTAR